MKKRFSFVLVVVLISLLVFVSCKSEPKHEHEYKEVVKTAATCTVAGVKEWKCECGEVEKTEEIPALDHDYTGACEKGHTICKACSEAKAGQTVTVAAVSEWKTEEGKSTLACGCDLPVTVDSVGPAGGYIIYDVDADNADEENDGLTSSACGWRYIEAAPGDLGKVGDAYSFDSSAEGYTFVTEKYGRIMKGNPLKSVYFSGTNVKDETTKTGLGEGKVNTLNVAALFEEETVYGNISVNTPEPITEYAVKTITKATVNGFNDWYIPSKDEIVLMLSKSELLKLTKTSGCNYWTSSEGNFSGNMRGVECSSTDINNYSAGYTFRIRPIRYF